MSIAADIVLLKSAPLSSSFTESKWLAIESREFTIDFALNVTNGPATVEYYLEFTSNPSGPIYREIAQEDNGGGTVLMPVVVRTFAENGGTDLPDGDYFLDSQYIRRHRMVRVQIRATAGTVRATITAPFGLLIPS